MKIKLLLVFTVVLASVSARAEYKDAWNTQNFYEAVHLCRSSIVFPTAKDYEAAGLKKGQTRFALRNELIANTRLFEAMASEVCYCALNQYAKDYAFSERTVKKMDFAEYLSTPDCKAKMNVAIESIKSNPRALTLP